MLTELDLEGLYFNKAAWEKAWLDGLTDWWPDSIALPNSSDIPMTPGVPVSAIPLKAQHRIEQYRTAGDLYVRHVDVGVHAYRIGISSEYL